jgi:hypothetical protein
VEALLGVGFSVVARMGVVVEEWEQCLDSVATATLRRSPKLANSLDSSSSGGFYWYRTLVGI